MARTDARDRRLPRALRLFLAHVPHPLATARRRHAAPRRRTGVARACCDRRRRRPVVAADGTAGGRDTRSHRRAHAGCLAPLRSGARHARATSGGHTAHATQYQSAYIAVKMTPIVVPSATYVRPTQG